MTELLTCTIHASRRLHRLLLALHGLAALSLMLAAIEWPLQLAGSGLVAASALWTLRQRPPVRLRCLADGDLFMADEMAGWRPVELQAGSLVSPMCTVLRLRIDGRSRSVVVLADSLAAEDFRRLRVWLRWKATWLRAPRWPVPRP
ncbi:MAG: hypothetical protein HXY26_06535 [Hydrogenophilaceae bacterium]|nr:hypothetical protein [Hydrogenophilaceae bacterium]